MATVYEVQGYDVACGCAHRNAQYGSEAEANDAVQSLVDCGANRDRLRIVQVDEEDGGDDVAVAVGDRVEAGDRDGYDVGTVHELRRGAHGLEARVGWDSGVETWIGVDLLVLFGSGAHVGAAPRAKEKP